MMKEVSSLLCNSFVFHRSVEVVDVTDVCMAPSLPHPTFGAGAAKVRSGVVVCGGFDSRKER